MQNQNQSKRKKLILAIVDHQSIVDQRQAWPNHQAHYFPTALIKQFERFGAVVRPLVLLDRHDIMGFNAYSAANYQIQITNGDRADLLHKVVQEILAQPLPDQLIIVSDDPVFIPLCIKAQSQQTQVSVWSPTGMSPTLLLQTNCEVQMLQSIFPSAYRPPQKVKGWIDAENYFLGVCTQQKHRTPQLQMKALTTALHQLGAVAEVHAYADFDILQRVFRCDVQYRLQRLGITTHQTKNIRGKNSADMQIARSIIVDLERDPNLTTVVIVSGDRDFCAVVEHAHELGKEVKIVAPRGSLSAQLESMADQVLFIEPQRGQSRYKQELQHQ